MENSNSITFGKIPDVCKDLKYVDFFSGRITNESKEDIGVTIIYYCPKCDKKIACSWTIQKIIDKIVSEVLTSIKNDDDLNFQCPTCGKWVVVPLA